MDQQEPIIIDLRPTPDNEWALIVHVAKTVMLVRDDPVVGTAYSAWTLPGKLTVRAALSDHRYVRKVPAPEGYCSFAFLKHQTAAQKLVPFETSKTFGKHQWLPMLIDLKLIADDSLPISTTAIVNGQEGIVSGPRYYERSLFVPGASEGTRFVIRRFYSGTRHSIPLHVTPLGTSVHYDVPGAQGNFPECLHRDIHIGGARTGSAALIGDAATPLSGQLDGQFYPRTNFTRWTPYVVDDRENEEPDALGGFLRAQVIALPPILPRRFFRRN